jgi:RNA polymerase sigma-70 factor (ECF subfamily)
MSFEDLLKRAVEGDELAFETLLQVYCSDIDRVIAQELPPAHCNAMSAGDILQEMRMQGLRDIREFRGSSEASFRAWMRQIAMNRLRDQIRFEERLKRGGNASLEQWLDVGEEVAQDRRHPDRARETPSRAAARNEAAGAVREAVDQLPEQERVAVTLHYLCNFDNKEIAKVMNRTPNAIRALLQRGRSRLRELLGSSAAWLSRYE